MQWLILDIGTTSIKGGVFDYDGQLLEQASSTGTQGSSGSPTPEGWWRACGEIIRELTPARTDSLAGIALTGQMQNLILLNASGELIRPVIRYGDQRGSEVLSAWEGDPQVKDLLVETGNEQGPTSVLAKLCWMQAHEPEHLVSARQIFLGSADYVAFRLTGARVTDTTTATTTGLMNLQTRAWHEPLLRVLGLEQFLSALPRLVQGGAEVGTLSSQVATDWGLPQELPVYLGPGDAGATTLGSGCSKPGRAYAYCGTSGWVGFTETAPAAPESGVFTLAHPEAGHFIQVAPILTAGGGLSWVKQVFEVQDYEALITEAMGAPKGELIYLPYLQGERSPFIDPHARGAWIGLSLQTEAAHLKRAVLEGCCLAFRHALQAVTQSPISELYLTGGTTRSPKFCQLFSDVIGLPVRVLSNSELTGLLGVLVSVAPESAASEPEVEQTFSPDPKSHEHYTGLFQIYLKAYPALKPVFSELVQTPFS